MAKPLLFLISWMLFCIHASPAFAVGLTKEKAWTLMKMNGFRWKQAQTLVAEAKAKLSQAKSARFPHLGIATQEYIGRLNQLQFGLPVGNLDIFTFGSTMLEIKYNILDLSISQKIQAAESNEKLNQHLTQQHQNDLTYVMLLQFLNIQKLQRKLNTIEANIKKNEEIVKLAKAKVRSGMGIELDVMRAKGLLEADSVKLLDAKLSLGKAKRDLALLLGKTHLDENFDPLVYRAIHPNRLQKSMGQIIAKRPDLLSLRKGVEAQEHLKRAAINEAYPKINLFTDVGITGTTLYGGPNHAYTGSLGIRLSMPLVTWGLLSGKTAEETAKMEKISYQLMHTETEAQSQVKHALDAISTAQQAVETIGRQIKIVKEETKIVQKKFKTGAAASFEWVTSQANLANVLDLENEAIFAYEVSKVNYYQAVGDYSEYFQLEK